MHKILLVTTLLVPLIIMCPVYGDPVVSVGFSSPQFSQILYLGGTSVVTVTMGSTFPVTVLHANMTWLWMPKTTVFQSRERNFALLEPQIIHFDIMAPSSIWMGRYKYFFTALYQMGSGTFTIRSVDYEGGVFEYWSVQYNSLLDNLLGQLSQNRYTLSESIRLAKQASDLLAEAEKVPYTKDACLILQQATDLLKQADELESAYYRQREQNTNILIGGTMGFLIFVFTPLALWKRRRNMKKTARVDKRRKTNRDKKLH